MDWTARLRLRHLKMLLSLAQTQNISRSAAALNTTQPGLSKWLKELEADIGLPLFERHARGLKPTNYGAALIGHAARIEAHLNAAQADMESMRATGSGRVVIGTSGASAADTVPLAVLNFVRSMPGAVIQLVESTMDRLLEQLQNGDIDLAVGRLTSRHAEFGLLAETLYVEPVRFVARVGHPLFAKPAVSWDDVLDFQWLIWPKGTPIRESLDQALASSGRELPPGCIQSNSVTLNLTMLNNSDMIGLASHRAAMRFARLNAMRIIPLPLSGYGSVAMYWRTDAPGRKAVAAMLGFIREASLHSSDDETEAPSVVIEDTRD